MIESTMKCTKRKGKGNNKNEKQGDWRSREEGEWEGVHISAQCPTYVYSLTLTLAHTLSHVACLWWHRRHIAAECNCIKVIRQQDKSGRGWWLPAADSWLLALPSKSKATFGAWRWCRSDVVKRKRCTSNGSWKGTNKSRLGKYFVMSSTLHPGNCCSRRHHHRHVDDTPSVCQSVSFPCPLPLLRTARRVASRNRSCRHRQCDWRRQMWLQ